MSRYSAFALTILAVVSFGAMAGAQVDGARSIPMGGTIEDSQGRPVGGASVVLVRRATYARGGASVARVATGRSDDRGAFSFGAVAIETEVAFPLETAVRFDYEVFRDGADVRVDAVSFTAPRSGGALASVAAQIRLR
jgi:hypothetical protein